MASGRPDYFGTIVSAGKYGDTFIPIAVDTDGNIIALMKGDYAGVLKSIAVDDNGIMKANLSVQDLDFLTVRPAYGQAVGISDPTIVPTGTLTSLHRVTGKGVVLSGYVAWGSALSTAQVGIEIDDTNVLRVPASDLNTWNITRLGKAPIFLSVYDTDTNTYTVCFTPGITFESSVEIKAQHSAGSDQSFTWGFFWALVP